ncbi:unnamed protein product [Rotaria sp. Silwood2]|nr:unnamed protein product [Rotaria sp. Silwood2]
MSLNQSKRSIHSSSNSDTSPLKKKTKIALKRNIRHSSSSSSSDDLDIPVSSTTRRNVSTSSKHHTSIPISKPVETSPSTPTPTPPPQPSGRIQIQRSSSSSSSSDDSNGSDEIVTKRTRQRRKKPTGSNERSNILKQMKRKTQERKNSLTTTTAATTTTTTTITDNNNNTSHNDSGNSLNGTKKCSFQFSDDDDDDDTNTNDDQNHKTTTNNYDIDDGDTTESYEVENDNEDNHHNKNGNIKNEYEYNEDEEENSSPTKHKTGHSGRKNIRKIIDDKELDIQTKQAVEIELERRNRIAEKQKEYNSNLLEQSSYLINKENEQVNNSNHRLILELDKTTNEPLIEVSPKLVLQLKPHQCDGIRFLWNNVFESIDAIENKKQGSGCILAHCMGLGKTLQVISFIHTMFNYDKITNVRTCLVLCPINAALNWSNEFEYWLNDVEPPVDNYQLTTIKPNLRVTHLNYWYEHGGVMIMGYEMYRRLANGFGLKNKKVKAQAYKCLVDPGPDIIVADEGHILKNAQTALAKCLSKIKTSRRIVLTGTPLQNNLIEYYCMVSFIKPNLLGSQQEYINRFVNPIQNGQHRDSNEEDVCLMKRRACVLHELLTGFIDRKDYSLLKHYLPPKFEYIINIRLSDLQTALYDLYLKQQGNQQQQNVSTSKKDFKSVKLFADYQYLQKIWTHPFLLYPHFIDHWKKRLNKDEDNFLDDSEFEVMFTDEDEEMEEKKKTKKKTNKKKKEKEQKPDSKKNFSGFLIDNVGDEDEGVEPSTNDDEDSKSQKRTISKSSDGSSVTTVESDSYQEDNDDDDGGEASEGLESDSKSKSKLTDNNNDDDNNNNEKVEIVKSYRTRSRTAAKNKEKQNSSKTFNGKNMNADVFDTGNDDNTPLNESTDDDQQDNSDQPWLNDMREQFWFPFLDMLPDESEFDINLSGKLFLLKSILDKCAEIGDKILLFSRSLYTLNYIERFLHRLQIQNEEEYRKQCESRRQLRQMLSSNGTNNNDLCDYIPQPIEWIRDQDYFRMDGQTDVIARKRYAKSFNDDTNLRARLFLISTLAGGIGINLVGSNRVIVFDASWNPSHDTQAIFRSYRFGQKKPVYIYRFLAQGTMEEKIYQRQVVKQSLSQRVIDDHQLDRHFTENDIKELYKFTPEQLPELRSMTNTDFNYPIPKDHLLLDLLYEHNHWIHSYHSHDSLLENKLDEGLSEEERRRALEEYENLKRFPDQRQLAAQRLQQQQQLASTAMVQIPHLQQMYLDFFRSMSSEDQRTIDYSKIIQYAFELGLSQQLSDIQNPTTSDSNQIQQTTTDTNDVVLLESDDDTTAKAE